MPFLTLRVAVVLLLLGCAPGERDDRVTITFSGSALGAEGVVLERQIARFESLHPGIRVRIQRTPDDASQRHQLFVQWLNARAGSPDVLQLDVIWTPEFAAAGWVLPLDRFHPDTGDFFPAMIAANRWGGELYAVPWIVDVGLLYWRTDLLAHPPASIDELHSQARDGMRAIAAADPTVPARGIVWQGARYEGLVTVFLEYLGAFGGAITDDRGNVVVDAPEAVRALETMHAQVHRDRIAPLDVLTWREEEVRFAFQNGTAVFMRNWPYAYTLLEDSVRSRVAGNFAVTTMPAAPGGEPTATLGGAQLAINSHSRQPAAAWALIDHLTAPEQMIERVEIASQFPTRRAVYDDPRLEGLLPIPVGDVRQALERARPRPALPIYTQLSGILQIELHRALVGQRTPAEALAVAAEGMRVLIERTRVRELMAGATDDGAR